MIITYKKHHPSKKETHFKERILLSDNIVSDPLPEGLLPKLHSFREDSGDRWKAGLDIQHYYGNHFSKTREHFHTNQCISTQKVEITRDGSNNLVIVIDGVKMFPFMHKLIANNDGFADLDQFKEWFKADFKGKIIHWTKLRY